MITVDEALARLFDLVTPLPAETVPLRHAAGRVLAQPVTAKLTQPPFPASAMDGYAVAGSEAQPGARFEVIGEAAAGSRFDGDLAPGQAVRIFTGAPVPNGADRIIIQEDVARDGDLITLRDNLDTADYVRPAGGDFTEGTAIPAGTQITARHVALIAAMNNAEVTVHRRPVVAIICTGDELVMPGETPNRDQIIASNCFGLAAQFEGQGAVARILPIAKDTVAALNQAFDLAVGADLIVTCGGASVGDHDLVAQVAQSRGTGLDFHKVAMRPGKPLMAGRMNGVPMVGLPGNPVSSMVCGAIFIQPMLRGFQGLPLEPTPRQTAPLAEPLGPNGKREHYMRGKLTPAGLVPMPRQDSSLLSVLAEADVLIVRSAMDQGKQIGDNNTFIPL
ncbi:MAG: gephyrin-like molybdotransferase Glp [Pseudomonadota bacterium]